MSSEKVIHFSKNNFETENYLKKKLERTSTRITNSPEIALSETGNDLNKDEVFEAGIEAPSPVQSSDETESVEVKYLSYLARVIDSAPEGSDSEEIESHYHQSEYWNVIFECAIYVKKDNLRTNIDDNLILSEISEYLIEGRIHPEAKNEIGKQVITNGYFLSAYAIATGRVRKSPFIFKYLMQYFENEFNIETNEEEFHYLMENYVYKEKTEEILNLEITTTPGENKENVLEINSVNNTLKSSIEENHLSIIRSPFLRPPIDEGSEDSKTINLDYLEQKDAII